MLNLLGTRAKKSKSSNYQIITAADQNARVIEAQDQQQIQLKKGVFIKDIKRIFFQ